jgi:hypothetical protein
LKNRFMLTAVAAVALMAACATTAQAFPTKTSACTGCHAKATTVKVAVVQTANDGVKATYSITVTGPNAILGWTVLNGATNVANANGGTGTFQVAVGKTYTVWGVSKSATAMASSNSISISPVAPVIPPTPVPTSTPVPTTPPVPTPVPTGTPEPTVTPVGTSTVSMRMHFEHPRGVIVKLKNAETGVVVTGVVNRAHNKVTFKNVPDGTYVLTVKYRNHKTKTVGTYTVSANTIARYVAPRPVETDDEDDDYDTQPLPASRAGSDQLDP